MEDVGGKCCCSTGEEGVGVGVGYHCWKGDIPRYSLH